MSVTSSRKRIGLQIQQMGSGFAARIWPGAVACAEARGVDLILFPGHNLDSPYGFEYQFNSIYKMMNQDTIDALVVYTSLIGNFVDIQTIQKFFHGISKIPVVSVGGIIPGIPSVVIDNKSGIKEMVRHFVQEHHARRIAFVKGPATNLEAEDRFTAYLEEIVAQKLSIDETLIAQGDFTWFCVPTVIDDLLEKCGELPDAIMFANDQMALRGLTYLQGKGLNLPGQLGISGFDDVTEASFSMPPLTSIRQPLYEMSWKALESTLDMLDGKPVNDIITFSPKVVIRTSCGCSLRSINTLYHTAEKANALPSCACDPSSLYDCVSSILLPKYLKHREKIIFTMIQKILDEQKNILSEESFSLRRGNFLEFFQEVLEDEKSLNVPIKDWQHILIVISESLYNFKELQKINQEIQLTLRLCSLLVSELSEVMQNSKNNHSDSVQNVLREVLINLSSIVQMDDLIDALHYCIPLLEINTFLFFMYEKPWINERISNVLFPEFITYVTGMIDHTPYILEEEAKTFATLNLIPNDLFLNNKSRILLMYPLFFRENQYGIIILELSKKTGFVIDSLISAISSIIKSIYVYQSKEKVEEKLRKTMVELEENNEQLNNLSVTDELTGLYNRRGFMKLAFQQQQLNSRMQKNSLIIFLDVDGLKSINDKYGHKEGDWIIQMAAEILRKTFRDMDIIARLGGDEFIVFIPNTGIEKRSVFQKRMNSCIKNMNIKSGKSFKLSLSIGAVECNCREEYSLEDYMKQADEKLYKEKRRKKDSQGK